MAKPKVTNDRFRVSSLLGDRLRERKVSVAEVLHEAGLPPHFLDQKKIHASTAQLFALWEAIGKVSGDPGIGLELGAEPRFERFDPPQIAAACSRNFRDALKRIARCKILICPEEIRVHPRGEETTVEFAFLNDECAEPDVLVDVCLSWTLAIGRRGTGGKVDAIGLELIRSAEHRELLEEHYGCPIVFGAKRNAIVFRTSDLDLPFITYNEELVKLLSEQLDQEIEAREAELGVREQVKRALKHSIAGKRPSREEVAKHLHLSLRTLQRRLQEAGVTFKQLVQDTRADLARQYLTDRSLELSEVAFLLGYEDPNSFIRAFQDWEGTSPGAWRERNCLN
ncbi:MAG: AraC family transcriptional regulator [Verrucomicrobiales bacterium]|nr:AraC family transcriptional regulator [Verrucomicrobiales bacterium]